MKKLFVILFSFIFLYFFPAMLNAQVEQDSVMYIVETIDGNTYVGSIVSDSKDELQLKTKLIGLITIPKDQISLMKPVRSGQIKHGLFLPDNPFSTRYFATSSGYGLKQGEGYYQNTWVLANSINVGVTDNFDLGVGVVPLFLFGVGAALPFWLTAKVTIPLEKDRVNLGIGGVYVNVLGGDVNGPGGGFVYGVTTFGSKDRNVSAGLGWGYGFDQGFSNSPTLMLSFIRRGKARWAFLSENYLVGAGDNTLLVLSGGARFIGKKLSIDMGGFTFFVLGDSQDIFPLLPWLSVSVPFGGNN